LGLCLGRPGDPRIGDLRDPAADVEVSAGDYLYGDKKEKIRIDAPYLTDPANRMARDQRFVASAKRKLPVGVRVPRRAGAKPDLRRAPALRTLAHWIFMKC
jgi:hypothetical protein